MKAEHASSQKLGESNLERPHSKRRQVRCLHLSSSVLLFRGLSGFWFGLERYPCGWGRDFQLEIIANLRPRWWAFENEAWPSTREQPRSGRQLASGARTYFSSKVQVAFCTRAVAIFLSIAFHLTSMYRNYASCFHPTSWVQLPVVYIQSSVSHCARRATNQHSTLQNSHVRPRSVTWGIGLVHG